MGVLSDRSGRRREDVEISTSHSCSTRRGSGLFRRTPSFRCELRHA
ncbi:hypothetical protein ACFFX0_08640 [Citricoccus parietis]|uniref:Uncharacterized protein n=1 Tax=Citricoccus parietis TaxID=592307 RepID=A0ABV5FX41_9MICC